MRLIRCILIVSFLTGLNSCFVFQPSLEKLSQNALQTHLQYDAVIVPGVPFNEPAWDAVMKMRVLWACHLYHQHKTTHLIMSGSSVYSPFVEGQIMKLYAMALGVPEQNILVEDKALHSTENLWYSYHLAKKHGLKAIALATDPFQARMTYRFGKRRLKDLQYIPVIPDSLIKLPQPDPKINYAPYKIEHFIPITQKQSWWYRMKGTWGLNIKYKEK